MSWKEKEKSIMSFEQNKTVLSKYWSMNYMIHVASFLLRNYWKLMVVGEGKPLSSMV